MISKETERKWADEKARAQEEKDKVIDFILFLMEKYDLDGINPLELK